MPLIKTLSQALRMDKERFKVPKSVQQAIPIQRIWPDGIFQQGTKFSKTYRFTDINYYGGRDEIVRAVQKIAQDVKEGKIAPEAIDEAMINANLDTKDIPDPDLLIRTSGEQRLSNYLPWQLAYTEFYFTDVFWPDFNREELIKACEKYNKRDRRYGGVKEE